MKNALKIACFLLCATVIFISASLIFERKTYDGPWNYMAKMNEFYAMEKNSLDYIGIGSSHMYCTFNPLEVWKESGITGFLLSTQEQPLIVSYHYIKEAFKTQAPKYVVLEGLMVSKEDTYDPAVIYNAVDPLKLSLNKIQMINNLVEYDERPNYYFNILKYHTRWELITADEVSSVFKKNIDTYKGFAPLHGTYTGANLIPDYESTAGVKLSEFNTKILNDIYDLVRKNNAKLIIAIAPFDANNAELCSKIKALIKWAKDKNLDILDYASMLNELKIDPTCDYYDSGHLDISGAKKVSLHFASYLQSKGLSKNTLIDQAKWQADYDKYVKEFSNELQ